MPLPFSSCTRLLEDGNPPRRTTRIAVMANFFLMGCTFGCWAGRIPDIKRALGLSDAALGSVLFAAPAGQFFALFVAPLLIARFGTRRVILASLSAYVGVLVLLGLAPAALWLAASLALFGFAGTIQNISINTQAVDVETVYARPIMSSLHGMWSLGGVFGGVLGSVAASLGVAPWQHFLAVALFINAALLFLSPTLRQKDLPRPAAQKGRRRPRLPRPDAFLLLLGLIALANMATEGTMYEWSAVFFAQVIHPEESLVRSGFVACMLAMVLGRFVNDRLVARFGTVRVLHLGGACVACGVALGCALPSVAWSTAGFALVGFGMSPGIPLCYSLTARCRSVSPSVAIALISTIGFFGLLTSPVVIGFLAQWAGLRLALLLLVVLGLAIAILPCLLPAAEAAQEEGRTARD